MSLTAPDVATPFYSVRHNSFDEPGYPWAARIISGLVDEGPCPDCGAPRRHPSGDISLSLERAKGSKWPDALGCGAYPLFIVSQRTIDVWSETSPGLAIGGKVEIAPPLPKKLETQPPPLYHWLEGRSIRGAALDFEASGFVGVRFCASCGNRTDNVGATYEKRRSGPWPYRFVAGSWNGAEIFTTDLSPASFFCTSKVREMSVRHGLTNLRFLPNGAG